MLIDAHSHFLPGRYPARQGFPMMEPIEGSTDRLHVFGASSFRSKDVFFEAERRLEALDASKLDAEVISPMPALLRYDQPMAEARAVASYVNDFAAELCVASPERLIGLGLVPLQDPDAATGELAAIKDRGLAGVEISSDIAGAPIGDPRFLPFFQEVARLGLSVFVHAMPSGYTGPMPPAARPTYVVGVEGMGAAVSLILGGTAAAVPDLRISFSHAAGALAMMLPRAHYFWSGTWNEGAMDRERAFAPDDGPSPFEYARRFYYDSLVFDRRTLRYLVDVLGADRLLVGSDFPTMPREEPSGRSLSEIGLSENEWRDVSWRNAMRWLGRDAT